MARLRGEPSMYPEPPRYMEIVMALRHGVMPEPGGLDDQPADFIDGLRVGLEALTVTEKSDVKKAEEALRHDR